jgi:magnesium transporter
VRISEGSTVGDAIATIRALEEVPDPLLAVYVVAADDPEVLRGIVRLRNLILTEWNVPLAEVMDDDAPIVGPEDRAEDAARVLAEYNLLAVPVLEEGRLVGIVTVDDALAELLPEVWQRRGARAFAA